LFLCHASILILQARQFYERRLTKTLPKLYRFFMTSVLFLPMLTVEDTLARQNRRSTAADRVDTMKQQGESGPSQLPTDRAFVIQLTASSDIPHRRIVGRIEHVVSGQSTRFQSLKELLTFIAQVLTQKQGKEDPS